MGAKIPVEIDGVAYPSVLAACKALGVGRGMVQRWVHDCGMSHGAAILKVLEIRSRKGRRGPGGGFPVTVEGRTYPSVKDACLNLGLSRWPVHRAISRGKMKPAAAVRRALEIKRGEVRRLALGRALP